MPEAQRKNYKPPPFGTPHVGDKLYDVKTGEMTGWFVSEIINYDSGQWMIWDSDSNLRRVKWNLNKERWEIQ